MNNTRFASDMTLNLCKDLFNNPDNLSNPEWKDFLSLSDIPEFKNIPGIDWNDPLYKTIDLYCMTLLTEWKNEIPVKYTLKKRSNGFKIWNTYSNRFDDEWNSLRHKLGLFERYKGNNPVYPIDWNSWYTLKAIFKNGLLYWMISNNLIKTPFTF